MATVINPSPTATGVGVAYHHTDHLGGSSVETDQKGNLVETLDYYSFDVAQDRPFGSVRLDEKTAGYENDYKYTGKELDVDTGLMYYEARYYNAVIGRFVSEDPESRLNPSKFLADPQQFNFYSYVRNNPLKYLDPKGESLWDFYKGFINSVASNYSLGLGRVNSQNTDFSRGQKTGDTTSLILGCYETATGLTMAAGGSALAVATAETGVGAVAGVAVATVGVGISAHGWAASITSSKHVVNNIINDLDDIIPPDRQNHILNGEPGPDGSWFGGHKAGTNKGKPEFPSSWSDQKIFENAADIATDPSLSWEKQGHGTFKVNGVRDGLSVSVIINNTASYIKTVFPNIINGIKGIINK